MTFKDRRDAGRLLAFALESHLSKDRAKAAVIGLPRGGVIVAQQVARQLKLPLDVMVIKKIGHPDNPEYAVGAVGEREIFLNPDVTISADYVKQQADELRKEIARQGALYHKDFKSIELREKLVIVVDDGIATGLTVKTAIAQLRGAGASKIIVAVPVAAPESLTELAHDADRVVCLYTPAYFMAVGQFYEQFEQVEEAQVAKALRNLALQQGQSE